MFLFKKGYFEYSVYKNQSTFNILSFQRDRKNENDWNKNVLNEVKHRIYFGRFSKLKKLVPKLT